MKTANNMASRKLISIAVAATADDLARLLSHYP